MYGEGLKRQSKLTVILHLGYVTIHALIQAKAKTHFLGGYLKSQNVLFPRLYLQEKASRFLRLVWHCARGRAYSKHILWVILLALVQVASC